MPRYKTFPTKLMTAPYYGVTDIIVVDCVSIPLALLKLPYSNLSFCDLSLQLMLTAEILIFLSYV